MADYRQTGDNEFVGGNDAQAIEHNQVAGSKKVLPNNGYPMYIGDGSAVRSVTRGAIVQVWNLSGSIGYVKVSDQTATGAPAAPGANIIPIPANSYHQFCMGPNATILGSASTIHIYEIKDHTTFVNGR